MQNSLAKSESEGPLKSLAKTIYSVVPINKLGETKCTFVPIKVRFSNGFS